MVGGRAEGGSEEIIEGGIEGFVEVPYLNKV